MAASPYLIVFAGGGVNPQTPTPSDATGNAKRVTARLPVLVLTPGCTVRVGTFNADGSPRAGDAFLGGQLTVSPPEGV